MCFWNVAGVKNKCTEVWSFLKQCDIIGLVETWVDEKEWDRIKKIYA